MKKVILGIIGMSAGLIFAMDASAIGFENSQNQGQLQGQGQSSYNKNYASSKSTGIGVGVAGSYSDGSAANNSMVYNESEGVKYSGTYRVKNTPNLGAIPVAASSASFNNGTCYGTIGFQGAIAGTGVGGSSTVEDKKCSRRYLAALAANLGTKEDGLRVACLEPEMLQANPTLCNKVYDAPTVATTAGDKINLTYRPKNDVASNNNGFIDF